MAYETIDGAVRSLGPVGAATDGLLLLQPAAARTRLRATNDTQFFQSFKAKLLRSRTMQIEDGREACRAEDSRTNIRDLGRLVSSYRNYCAGSV